MPSIGKPNQGKNDFANIQMAQKRVGTGGAKKSVGDSLNQLAGVAQESRFVEREKHNKMGKDGFLKLLSHQMQNQDPMKPMDQKQFAADLAQFSQLEQMTNMNAKLDGMKQNAPQELKFYGASFLGKEVITSGTTLNYNGSDRSVDVPFFLEKPAKHVMVNIYDSKRQLVKQLEVEGLGKGQQSMTWGGDQLDGTRAVKDAYTFQVMAWDEQMNEFKGETKGVGVVKGVDFENGETVLTLDGGKKVFLKDVDSFKLPEQAKNFGEQKNPALQKSAAKAYNGMEQQL